MNIHLYSGEIRCFQEFEKIIVQVFKSVLSLKLIALFFLIKVYLWHSVYIYQPYLGLFLKFLSENGKVKEREKERFS